MYVNPSLEGYGAGVARLKNEEKWSMQAMCAYKLNIAFSSNDHKQREFL